MKNAVCDTPFGKQRFCDTPFGKQRFYNTGIVHDLSRLLVVRLLQMRGIASFSPIGLFPVALYPL